MRTIRFPNPMRRQPRGQRTTGGKLRVWPLLAFGVFAFVYYLSNQETVPLTGRTQLVDISKEQEAALGLQSYSAVLSQSTVLRGGPVVEKVRTVGNRIAAVTDQPDFKWEFNVIQSDQENAFCLPGGKVAVYTGILPVTKNDAGLATVLGHEIAHAIARHGAERMAHQRLTQFASMAVGMSTSEMKPEVQQAIMGAFGIGSQVGMALPFSRSHESEADYMGLMYLAKACYDPGEAPRLWERMGKIAAGGVSLEMLSTHPLPATRVKQFEEWLPEARAVYEKNCL